VRWGCAAVLLAAVLLLVVSRADARPGGGQGYSGGTSRSTSGGRSGGSYSSSSSSSSSGGPTVQISDGTAIFFLCVIVVAFGFVGIHVLGDYVSTRNDRAAWEAQSRRRAESEAREARTDYLASLRERDPAFSRALFEDYVRALFAKGHASRHDPAALARLAPYLAPAVRSHLQHREPVGAPVVSVVVGALSLSGWRENQMAFAFVVDAVFEANLVRADATEYTRETWTFARSCRARTRPWEGVRTFGCPSCGAPLERVAEELCQSCGQQVKPARFDWSAVGVGVDDAEDRASSMLETVAEKGTDLPTIFAPDLAARKAALLADDPQALTGLEARLSLIFTEMNRAWASQDLRRARPYLSAGLFASLEQQIETYRSQGLVNRVDGARITRSEMAKLARDPRQDALTLRVFGTGCDFTLEKASGRVVAGSQKDERPYSEYWTLVRSSEARGAPRADKSCPSCGAPLDVGMEGNCTHCGVLVASGEFDWVLSGIDQDDSYRG
jgi:hypothetical protein